jgi:ABC-type sugar transport system substrate-binding protein
LACGIGLTASASDPFRPAWPAPAADADFVPVGPWNTDGLIIVNPLHSSARSGEIQDLIAAGHPVLFVGSGEGQPEIVADNAQGILQAIRHLADHGHRRIAFIAGSQDDLAGDSGIRLQAYQAALAADARLIPDPALIAFGRHVFDGGYTAMEAILACGIPFTAVLASNDESAFGARQALAEAGRRVPEDVALIGFDDRLETLVQIPPLTSVRIPLYDLGYEALSLLLEMIAGRVAMPVQRRVPTRLVVRRSCGCDGGVAASPAHEAARPPAEDAPPDHRQRVVQAMIRSVQVEARHLNGDEVRVLCERLSDAFATGPDAFQQTLEEVLRRCEAAGEDLSLWQAALAVLRQETSAGSRAAGDPSQAVSAWAVFTGTWSPSCCWPFRKPPGLLGTSPAPAICSRRIATSGTGSASTNRRMSLGPSRPTRIRTRPKARAPSSPACRAWSRKRF